MLKTSSAISLALVAFAGAASADGLSYASVDASYFDLDDVDAHAISGEFDYVTGQLSFTGGAGLLTIDDVDTSALFLSAGYAIQPGLTVYAALGYADVDGAGDDTSMGLGIEYQTGDYGVVLDYTAFDEADVDFVTLAGYYSFGASTVYASYSDGDNFEAYMLGYTYEAANWDFDALSVWGDDFDDGTTAIASSFDLNDTITLASSIMTFNDDMFDNGIVTVGGQYHFNESTYIEANYGTTFGDVLDGDGFNIALSWELGERRLRVIDQISDYAEDATPLFDFAGSL